MYWKGAIDRTDIERPFLQFLPPYVVISNRRDCSLTGTIYHVHGGAPKTVFHAQSLMHENV